MKTATIEELLSWAFVQELPKGGGVDGLDNANSAWRMIEASSWGKVTRFAELMTMIDTGPGDRENFWIEQGEPHDDAVSVGEAVAGLAACDVVVPAGWPALADWLDTGGLAEAAVARTVERFMLRTPVQRAAHVVSLVVGCAVLGKAPDHEAEPLRVRMVERGGRPAWFVRKRVTDELGKVHEIETDGYNARSQRPVRGAYRRYELSADPTGDILGRLDYQIWVAALRRLDAALTHRLVAHRLARWDRLMTPWLGEDAPAVAIVVAPKKSRRSA